MNYLLQQAALAYIKKSNPTGSEVHINAPLTDISTAYIQDEKAYVANSIFPSVPSAKQSNTFFTYNKGDLYRVLAEKRAPGSESAGGEYNLGTDTFNCDVWAFHKDVADQTRDNEDEPLDSDSDATQFVTQILLIRREVEFFSNYFTTSLWSADVTPSVLWDAANSNPITDIEEQISNLISGTGMMKEDFTLSMGYDVWSVIKNHPEVIARITNTTSKNPTLEIFAAQLEIKQVVVGQAVKNSAVKGAADDIGFIATEKSCLLTYAPEKGSKMKPSAGYIFKWTGHVGAGSAGSVITKLRAPLLKSDRIEGEMSFDMKLVASDCGIFFDGVIS